MHTIRENTLFLWRKLVSPRKAKLLKTARNIALLVALAFFLECVVFNINFFRTLSNEPIDISSSISAPKTNRINEEGVSSYVLTSDNHTLEFTDLDVAANCILLDFDDSQTAQALRVKIQFTDDAHMSYFDSTEYTEGIPLSSMSTAFDATQFINLKTSGNLHSIKLEIMSDGSHDLSYPIYLERVQINPNRPFEFVSSRFFFALLILLAIYCFRPKSAIYRISIRENDVASKVGILTALFIEISLASTFLFFGSNLVGVATSTYNYGNWDGHSIVNTFDVGGENSQQYAKLARAFAHGSLSLEDEVPEWLTNLENPYDKASRDEAAKESGQDYLFDVAYYQGAYYVYFGVVPVILFYLPFFLLTGANFPTAIGVLMASILFFLGITALLHRFAKYHFKRVNLGIFLLLQVAIVVCSGVLYLLKFPTFYSLPIALAVAFTVWGLYFWMRFRHADKRKLGFFAGSLCMALVVGCRPQLAVLSILAFPLFWRPYIKNGRIKTKEGFREFLCLILPYVIVITCLLAYNYARFGSFLDFGANYNLTVNDMTKRGVNFGRVAPAIFMFFLQTPATSGVFPFLQETAFQSTYFGQTIREATFGGIFACLPILWVIILAFPVLKIRNAQRKTKTVTGVVWSLMICGVIVAILDAEGAGILQRYFADFSFMFLSSAVLIAFILNENALVSSSLDVAELERDKGGGSLSIVPLHLSGNLLYKVIILTVTVSVLYSVLLCFVPESGWYSDVYAWCYEGFKHAVLFWT